jgi:uncharacterized protein YktA (UPF0223 family)
VRRSSNVDQRKALEEYREFKELLQVTPSLEKRFSSELERYDSI